MPEKQPISNQKSKRRLEVFSKEDSENPWTYPEYPENKNKRRKPGAFRAIAVGPLLAEEPRIELYEWKNITYRNNMRAKLMQGIEYVAISHVWGNSVEVAKKFAKIRLEEPEECIKIQLADNKTHRISWAGLIEAARGARFKKAKFFWLDLLCLDQVDSKDRDKELQIALMADVYKNASCVIIMIAGIVAVGRVEHHSPWIDRAWTLQEAVLNLETYVYVEWSRDYKSKLEPEDESPIQFSRVGQGANCLIKLKDMLRLADTNLKSLMKNAPKVNILDSRSIGKKRKFVPRILLFTAAFAEAKEARNEAKWKSMFLRQSSHPVDIVYSLMGCFGMDIDPFHNYKTPEEIFGDLARKGAIEPTVGPGWLTVFGLTGSGINRCEGSPIIPKFPKVEPNKPPKFPGNDQDVSQLIDISGSYIKKYDIKFVTQSFPHIISAVMHKITKFEKESPAKNQQPRASIFFGTISGTCLHRGSLSETNYKGVYGIYVGNAVYVAKRGEQASNADWKYFLFLQWNARKTEWIFVGDGIFRMNARARWPGKAKRSLLTVGNGLQKQKVKFWPQVNRNLLKWFQTGQGVPPKERQKRPCKTCKYAGDSQKHTCKSCKYPKDGHQHTCKSRKYGFTRLANIPAANSDNRNYEFEWVGDKSKPLMRDGFTKLEFKIDGRDFNAKGTPAEWYGKPDPILFVGCTTRGIIRPKNLNVAAKNIAVYEYEKVQMQWVDHGRKVSEGGKKGLAKMPGFAVPARPKRGNFPVKYWMKVLFSEGAVYFVLKQGEKTLPRYYQVYVFGHPKCCGEELTLEPETHD